MEYVDWVNLMSYDLHGVWDSDNPIGNHVLSHTNLTEIDLALDLFWRNDVEPSKIVLGLGFYGRSFKLSSSSCWKPGCDFSGPGLEGECTKSAGILSYRGETDTGISPSIDWRFILLTVDAQKSLIFLKRLVPNRISIRKPPLNTSSTKAITGFHLTMPSLSSSRSTMRTRWASEV